MCDIVDGYGSVFDGLGDLMDNSRGWGWELLLVTCGLGPKVSEEVLSKQRKEERAGLTLSPVTGFLSSSSAVLSISFPPSVPDPWAPGSGQLSSLPLVPGNSVCFLFFTSDPPLLEG